MLTWVVALFVLALPAFVSAELSLPSGFTAGPYVTGQGFDGGPERGAPGIPAVSTLGFDRTGVLYLARSGARFRQGEAEDLTRIYRIPAGGARLTPETEARYLHGPPLTNPQVAAVGGEGDLFVTTYDRDRRIGAIYRMVDGRPRLFAGGTSSQGEPALLKHPEGAAIDALGRVYVADRERGAVVRFDAAGRVLDPQFATLPRPRMLALDEQGELWIAGDGTAETPFQDGAGQIWKVSRDGGGSLVLQGPLPAGLGLGPARALFVAQRRTGRVFVLTPEGRQIEFASTGNAGFLRGLAFAPVTPETRRAGIAGDLFLILVRRQAWMVNDIIRVSGPFDELVRAHR